MLTIIDWNTTSPALKKQTLRRCSTLNKEESSVRAIIDKVKAQGDSALIELTKQFDGVDLTTLELSPRLIKEARTNEKAEKAITTAIQTISQFHEATLPQKVSVQTAPGLNIQKIYKPIQRVGLYVPGGNSTPLISSLLMQAIPAHIAGCPVKIVCTPPNSEGRIDVNLLTAARLCGIEQLYVLGGAQAIAAMAYGTETVPKVDKIFGPGNAYVTQAKTLVAQDPAGAAIDMPAGPSEVMILADAKANAVFIAADLLAQAEHGPDSQVFCLCDNWSQAEAIKDALNLQLKQLSRLTTIQNSLKHSALIVCPNTSDQVDLINYYAPEHLIINRLDAHSWIDAIHSAGTIFLGPWAAETMGDYVSGSNHVLPTSGYARNYSGLSTLDFLKGISVQSINEEALKNLGPAAQTLANLEGLEAHAQAVRVRLEELGALQ